MIAYCVDDEIIMLESLKRAVMQSPDISHVETFCDPRDALERMEVQPCDIAFLDIVLQGMDGLTLAEEIRKKNPKCGIVFCTVHTQYAYDAIRRHVVDGFLIKPIHPESIQAEINYIKEKYVTNQAGLTVILGKSVSVFNKENVLVIFRRRKTPEMLRVLIEHEGRSVSAATLCKLLWKDSDVFVYQNRKYLNQLAYDLRHTLEREGFPDLLIKTADGYALDMRKFTVR